MLREDTVRAVRRCNSASSYATRTGIPVPVCASTAKQLDSDIDDKAWQVLGAKLFMTHASPPLLVQRLQER